MIYFILRLMFSTPQNQHFKNSIRVPNNALATGRKKPRPQKSKVNGGSAAVNRGANFVQHRD
jgi:hypothetical protein